MGQGWSLSTRRQVPRVWRWKHGLGEKRPQVPFYFLVPNQERKQQPQINTQMIHKQDNTLSTLLSLRCAKPHKCKWTSSRTRHKSYEIPLSDRAPQIQSKLAYAEQEASAEGKGAPRCTRWGDVSYFQLMPLGSQKHSKQMGQVPQSWLCSTEVPRHRWLCPRGGKPGWRKYSGLRTWERLTPETKPTADRSPKVLTAPEPCAEGGQHLPGTSPQVPKQNGRGSCSGLHGGTPAGAGLLWAPSPGTLAKLVPAQSPCAQCLERPKLKISESGSKKGLLTEKAPTEMGDLTFKFVSKKCRVQAFSMSGKEERGRAVFYKTQAASRIPQWLACVYICMQDEAKATGAKNLGAMQAWTRWSGRPNISVTNALCKVGCVASPFSSTTNYDLTLATQLNLLQTFPYSYEVLMIYIVKMKGFINRKT